MRDVLMPHALRGLIEQHQVRLERQRGRQFQRALAAIGQIRRQRARPGFQVHLRQQFHRAPIEIRKTLFERQK